jgi:glutaredoxin 3
MSTKDSHASLPVPAKVTIYCSDLCGFCYRAKRLLETKRVDYEEISVDGNTEARRHMVSLTGGHTVPQIIINGQPIGGCDDLYALERANQLDAILIR